MLTDPARGSRLRRTWALVCRSENLPFVVERVGMSEKEVSYTYNINFARQDLKISSRHLP